MQNSIGTRGNLCTGLGPPVIDGTFPACARDSASRMRLEPAIQVPPITNLEFSTKNTVFTWGLWDYLVDCCTCNLQTLGSRLRPGSDAELFMSRT